MRGDTQCAVCREPFLDLSGSGVCLACVRFVFGGVHLPAVGDVSDQDTARRTLAADLADMQQSENLTDRKMGVLLGISSASICRFKKNPTGTVRIDMARAAEITGVAPSRYGVMGSSEQYVNPEEIVVVARLARERRARGALGIASVELKNVKRTPSGSARATQVALAELSAARAFVWMDLARPDELGRPIREMKKAFDYLGGEVCDTKTAFVASNLGNLYRMNGHYAEAEKWIRRALRQKTRPSTSVGILILLARTLCCRSSENEFKDIMDLIYTYLGEPRRIYRSVLVSRIAVIDTETQGYLMLGHPKAAREAAAKMTETDRLGGSPQWQITWATTLAQLAVAEGNLDGAVEYLVAAATLASGATAMPRQRLRALDILRSIDTDEARTAYAEFQTSQ